MLSDHRLHPASILFALGGSLKAFALPALLLFFSSLRPSRSTDDGPSSWGPSRWVNRWIPGGFELENWQLWGLLLLVPATIASLIHFLTFRIRYEGSELVIRSGLVFRNERHVPYARIQNLDARRTVLHRLLGVAEVHIETGGGSEPEARISVLHTTVFEEMRARIFEGRARAGLAAPAAPDVSQAPEPMQPVPDSQTLLQLPVREVLLLGLLENRGLLLVAAAYGALWELGLQGWFWERLTSGLYAPGMLRDAARQIGDGRLPPLWQLGVLAGGLVGLLVVVRVLSMIWAGTRLHGFRLARVGDDLRTEYGLLTRITTTIPRARIQTLSLRESPLQRLVGRMSVHVETAGGATRPEDGPKRPRERLAPIIPAVEVPALVRQVMPQADVGALDWTPVHPRAFRRAIKPLLLLIGLPSLLVLALVGWQAWPAAAAAIGIAVLVTRKQVQHLAWAATEDVVALRRGWLWRSVTITPVAKIQTVSATESPFDRRAAMAAVQVDTASGRELTQRLHIPYLARETARALFVRLSTQAAQTAFRW